MKTLVLGVGNPILTDDAVGIRIAQQIEPKANYDTDVVISCEGVISLLEAIDDHDRLIIVDSIKTGKGKPGDLYRFTLDTLCAPSGFATSHGFDITAACNLLQQAGSKTPQVVTIYAVEVSDNTTFGEKCTVAIEKRIPEIARQIAETEHL